MERNEVREAFGILLEVIKSVVHELNEEGARALRMGRYERAQAIIREAERITEFHAKVEALYREWNERFQVKQTRRKRKIRRTQNNRLPRGLRTPEDAFRRPILEALVEAGGRASIREVLVRVEEKMAGMLNEYDYETLPSSPKTVRWRNTAQWCRNRLVREGYMRDDSPYGIWEISEKGRAWLREQAVTV